MKYLVIAGLITLGVLCSGMDVEYKLKPTPHVVQPGQTLWVIATQHKDANDKPMTMDEFVSDITKLNNLSGKSFIQPGQVIKIPLYKKVEKK